ncbi:hypothetical protein GBAR_LOCUS29310, partial [Geodia barretti]
RSAVNTCVRVCDRPRRDSLFSTPTGWRGAFVPYLWCVMSDSSVSQTRDSNALPEGKVGECGFSWFLYKNHSTCSRFFFRTMTNMA